VKIGDLVRYAREGPIAVVLRLPPQSAGDPSTSDLGWVKVWCDGEVRTWAYRICEVVSESR